MYHVQKQLAAFRYEVLALRVDQIREFDRILDEEDGNIIADKVDNSLLPYKT